MFGNRVPLQPGSCLIWLLLLQLVLSLLTLWRCCCYCQCSSSSYIIYRSPVYCFGSNGKPFIFFTRISQSNPRRGNGFKPLAIQIWIKDKNNGRSFFNCWLYEQKVPQKCWIKFCYYCCWFFQPKYYPKDKQVSDKWYLIY